MGQKVNPNSLRFGINKNWLSRWNTKDGKLRAKWILEEEKIRALLASTFKESGVGHVEIERFLREDRSPEVVIYMHVAQMGYFASNGESIAKATKQIKKILGTRHAQVTLSPIELANPHVCANLIAQEIVDVIENRLPHRSTIKKLMKKSMSSGASGIKIKISGRINGVEIARSESYVDGSVPLSTLRADIDYSFRTAKTSYGIIGIKVWVNRGLYMGKSFMPLPEAPNKINKSKDTNKHITTVY